MLQSLHGVAQKWVGILLFSVLILSFVMWGIADVFQSKTMHENVITVGELKITSQQLQREVMQEINYMRQMTGRTLSMKEAADFGIIGRTINGLVNRALLEQEAERIGLRISDSIVLDTVRSIQQFKKEDGTFDAAAFKAALANVGMNEAGFIADQRISIAREKLVQAITSGISVPDYLVKALEAAQKEQRSVETYQIKFAAEPKPTLPDDAVLIEYMKSNAEQFTSPEYRKLSFVRMTPSDVANDINISDDEAKQAYETRKAEFDVAEKRTFKQILVGDKDKAEKIAAAAKGKDLSAAAKANSETTIDLKDTSKADLPDSIQEKAFGLAVKDVSEPLESSLGWHVLQLVSVTPAKTADFSSVKEKIVADLRQQKASDEIVRRSQKLDDAIASGADLAEIAGSQNLVVQQVEKIDVKGFDDKGNNMGAVVAQPQMLAEAFTLQQGQQSDLIITPNEEYYVVKVESVTPSALKLLEGNREQVAKSWTLDAQKKSATEKAATIVKALRDGATLEKIASQFKVESSIEPKLTRTDAKPSYVGDDFVKDVFGLKKDETTQSATDKAIVVARLKDIVHPVTIAAADATSAAKQTLAEDKQSEVFNAYAESLKKRYPVKVDEPRIAALFKEKAEEQ